MGSVFFEILNAELSALGIFQPLSSNILEFFKALPECARERGISFSTFLKSLSLILLYKA